MSRRIRKLVSEPDLAGFSRLTINAYPGMATDVESLAKRLQERNDRDDASSLWGCFEDQGLLGGMRLLDFRLNYAGTLVPAGGLGSLAVGLVNKKQGVARDLVQFFLDYYEERGAYMALLYPFRPDFYQRMGFGYGPKMHQYSFSPADLPAGGRQHGVTHLGQEDLPLLERFYTAYTQKQHGFCQRSAWDWEMLLKNLAAAGKLVGYKRGGELGGYLAFTFERAHETSFIKNNLRIREWLWDGPDALHALCTFLASQADQFHRVLFGTQDHSFHFLLKDPRNGTDNLIPSVYHESHTSGVGLMYRIISVAKFLEATAFRNYNGLTLDLALTVEDSFRPANAGTYHLVFEEGQVRVSPVPRDGLRLSLDIADLSALVMGSVDLSSLYRLGRAGPLPASAFGAPVQTG